MEVRAVLTDRVEHLLDGARLRVLFVGAHLMDFGGLRESLNEDGVDGLCLVVKHLGGDSDAIKPGAVFARTV